MRDEAPGRRGPTVATKGRSGYRTTYAYEADSLGGNLTGITGVTPLVTVRYGKENRLVVHVRRRRRLQKRS